MKISHYRSPSDPGPYTSPTAVPKQGPEAGSNNNGNNQFATWLQSVTSQFKTLSDQQRLLTLDTIVNSCGLTELKHLSDVLPSLMYRDFIRFLPAEISVKILILLDEKSLLNCCLVSKFWNSLINGFGEIWIHMARHVGAKVESQLNLSAQESKKLFLRSTNLIHKMKNRSAFEVSSLDGHRSRVMAVHYNKGLLATGSNDHTVRFWDVGTGECVRLLHTHTVSSLMFDENLLFTASYDATAACWDIDIGQQMVRYIGHTSAVFSIDVKRAEDILVTGSADKTVKIWQLSSGALLNSLTGWHNDWVTSIRILSLIPGHGGSPQSLHCVSVDRQGCCFWKMAENGNVEGTATHATNWCMNFPSVTKQQTISICTWVQRDRIQSISSYAIDTIDQECEKPEPCLLSKLSLPKVIPPKQTVLGIGRKFAVFIVDLEYSSAVIVDLHSHRVLCSIPVPLYSATENGASATLGDYDWLDGFTDTNRKGLFLAASIKDNTILCLSWKDVEKCLL